ESDGDYEKNVPEMKIMRKIDNGPDGMEPEGIIKNNWNEIVDNFDDMNLSESLLHGIYACGFEKPSTTQPQAWHPLECWLSRYRKYHGVRRLLGCLLPCLH
uniref:DEAD-box RNA helicase Q domain-containing protein n=2 Tax=Canis lupus familiaris TaxID=9615 RepID=A0A8C0Z3C7_CANLF